MKVVVGRGYWIEKLQEIAQEVFGERGIPEIFVRQKDSGRYWINTAKQLTLFGGKVLICGSGAYDMESALLVSRYGIRSMEVFVLEPEYMDFAKKFAEKIEVFSARNADKKMRGVSIVIFQEYAGEDDGAIFTSSLNEDCEKSSWSFP